MRDVSLGMPAIHDWNGFSAGLVLDDFIAVDMSLGSGGSGGQLVEYLSRGLMPHGDIAGQNAPGIDPFQPSGFPDLDTVVLTAADPG